MSLSAVRLRPGPAAEKWLVERLQALKGGDPLRLSRGGFDDRTDVCRAASAATECGGARLLEDWGPLLLYLPARISAPELQLLAALAKVGTVEAGLPWLDDETADSEPRRWATAMGIDWEAAAAINGNAPKPSEVLMASDAGEEVRAAVRRVLTELEAHRVPLHRPVLVFR